MLPVHTEVPVPWVTIAAAVALFVGSAWLVATTWNIHAVLGAAYKPVLVIVPPAAPSSTLQLIAVLLVPVTAAVKVCVPPGDKMTVAGVTLTVIAAGLTVVVDESVFGAKLVAVSMAVFGTGVAMVT